MKPKARQKPRDIDKSPDRISQNISITHAQHLTHMSHISGYELDFHIVRILKKISSATCILRPIFTEENFPQKEKFCKVSLADTNFPSEKIFNF